MVSRVVEEFPTFYGSVPYIALLPSQSHIRQIQRTPFFLTSSGLILILFCHLCPDFPSGLFHSVHTKPVNVYIFSSIRTTCSTLVILDLVILLVLGVSRVAQSVYRLTTGWTVRGSNPGEGEISRTCADRPWAPPSLLYSGYRVFPGGKAAGAWCRPPTRF
jgi:hypothetical protein